EGAPDGRHGAARVRAADAAARGGARGALPGSRGEPQRLAARRGRRRALPRGRLRRGRPLPGAPRRGCPPARRRNRVRPLRCGGGPPRGRRPAGNRRQHERALGLRFPLRPEAAHGRGCTRQRARLDGGPTDHDLRLRARQERPPSPALPGPLPGLSRVRPRHEPLAARLPRGLRPRRLRGPRPPRRRRPFLRPARRRAAPLRGAGRDGRARPGQGATPRPAAAGAHTPDAAPHGGAGAAAADPERAGAPAAGGQSLPLRRRPPRPRLRAPSLPRRHKAGGRPVACGRASEAETRV
ncbi:MAG: hypothetical protein AVDCRST_MAG55-396, partial [uncultured Rubrobacteraceae bacterium]